MKCALLYNVALRWWSELEKVDHMDEHTSHNQKTSRKRGTMRKREEYGKRNDRNMGKGTIET
jgi:hypothetical protein